MHIAIVSSTKDPASSTIRESLTQHFGFKQSEEKFEGHPIYHISNNKEIKLYTTDSELVYADNLDKKIDSDIFVFISRHRAEEGRASLTAHAIGNFGKALVGGRERALCKSPSFLLKNIFLELSKNVECTNYEATLEATHHGPYLEKPVLFVELGSTELQWNDVEGGKIVAKSLINAIKNFSRNDPMFGNKSKNKINDSAINKNIHNSSPRIKNGGNDLVKSANNSYGSALVIGGGHYNHLANKATLQSSYAVGHICPKYNFEDLDEKMLLQAMEKIIPKPDFALLDWKGLGKGKQKILEMLENNKIEYRRSDKFFQ